MFTHEQIVSYMRRRVFYRRSPRPQRKIGRMHPDDEKAHGWTSKVILSIFMRWSSRMDSIVSFFRDPIETSCPENNGLLCNLLSPLNSFTECFLPDFAGWSSKVVDTLETCCATPKPETKAGSPSRMQPTFGLRSISQWALVTDSWYIIEHIGVDIG